jgi:hypothetical protein
MGTYIIFKGEGIFIQPKGLLKQVAARCVLFLLTPIVPCLDILKVSTIMDKKKELVQKWENSPHESASTVSTAYDDEIQLSMKTYSRLKIIEATLECFPQIILLLAYFLVSWRYPQVLGISEKGHFFAANILFSICTLVMSIINFINKSKGEQMVLKQKLVLALTYVLQIFSRIIPIFLVIALIITKQITIGRADGVMLSILPIILHWLAQYVICHLTAPGFKGLKLFEQILHVLINTFVVIPLRTSPGPGHQVHKSKQIFWSFILFAIDTLTIFVITIYIGGSGAIDYLVLFGIPSLLLLLLSSFTLILFYRCSHTWKDVNTPRERSRCCGPWPALCCIGSLGQEIQEENDSILVDRLQQVS